jgi:hypothetical protein
MPHHIILLQGLMSPIVRNADQSEDHIVSILGGTLLLI